jgi:hypothetical protein
MREVICPLSCMSDIDRLIVNFNSSSLSLSRSSCWGFGWSLVCSLLDRAWSLNAIWQRRAWIRDNTNSLKNFFVLWWSVFKNLWDLLVDVAIILWIVTKLSDNLLQWWFAAPCSFLLVILVLKVVWLVTIFQFRFFAFLTAIPIMVGISFVFEQ